MESPVMNLLKKYCEHQGIELRNMEEVANKIDYALSERVIPNIVHEFGDLVQDEEE